MVRDKWVKNYDLTLSGEKKRVKDKNRQNSAERNYMINNFYELWIVEERRVLFDPDPILKKKESKIKFYKVSYLFL